MQNKIMPYHNSTPSAKPKTGLKNSQGVYYAVGLILAFFLGGSALLFCAIYFGIMAAYRIGDLVHLSWLGYPLVTGAYFLVGYTVWLMRKYLLRISFLGTLVKVLLVD